MWLYEANRDVCWPSALGCSELPSKCTLEFSNTEIVTYKTKIKTTANKTNIKTKFCWSEASLVIRPKFQTTSLEISSGLGIQSI